METYHLIVNGSERVFYPTSLEELEKMTKNTYRTLLMYYELGLINCPILRAHWN